jgi:hypothetical protein
MPETRDLHVFFLRNVLRFFFLPVSILQVGGLPVRHSPWGGSDAVKVNSNFNG